MGVVRGYRTCIEDGKMIVASVLNPETRKLLESSIHQAIYSLNTITNGVGAGYFLPKYLHKPYDLDDVGLLDQQIQEDLGSEYTSSLNEFLQATPLAPKEPAAVSQADGDGIIDTVDATRSFDTIYVNERGHGLLHYAASMGNLTALQHLVEKYQSNIDLPNQNFSETPLVCACRGGHFDCAMYLLASGANPSGNEFGEEAPLHWLCSFEVNRINEAATRLLDAGGSIEQLSGTMRPEIRDINADWDGILSIAVTPLGRAVIMKSMKAVDVLLHLGADPMAKPELNNKELGKSAIELAAVMILPAMLEVLLEHLDELSEDAPEVFDEGGMLSSAHGMQITPYDTTSVQSRLVRCGSGFKTDTFKTLQLLRERRLSRCPHDIGRAEAEASTLCTEVQIGNTDIVECLLDLGYNVDGEGDFIPIADAVTLNHELIFRHLINHGADVLRATTKAGAAELTLLQICANRPKTSRPGLFIAEYLIKANVPIEAVAAGSRAPFALASLNQNFEMAELLLAHGANLNTTYVLEPQGPLVTVLMELLRSHTERNLTSIEYLFQQASSPRASRGPATLDFIVEKSEGLSALHVLAACPQDTMNSNDQISARIIQTVLSTFKDEDQINLRHPIYGTALCIASRRGNMDMVSALLERGADQSISIDMASTDPIHNDASLLDCGLFLEPGCPLALTFSAFSTEFQKVLDANGDTVATTNQLQLLVCTAELLINADPEGNVKVHDALMRLKALTTQAEVQLKAIQRNRPRERETTPEAFDLMKPVDLRVLGNHDEIALGAEIDSDNYPEYKEEVMNETRLRILYRNIQDAIASSK